MSQTQSQSTPNEEVTKDNFLRDVLIGVGVLVIGVIAILLYYRNFSVGTAKSAARAYWEEEENANGKRLFGEAWENTRGHGFN